ncbi:GNAT family N-acetyltransferase [Streptosporangiaceae bacterium NEAU-GS5]|nr:GNAT family N-acetyltransferase [Streptosporangiaceae bacterium NEAU-GS5]
MDARLTSDRLTLRPVEPADAPFLQAHWSLPEVRRHLFDGEEVSQGLVEEIVNDSRSDFAERGYGLWAMLSDGVIVGVCGLRATQDGQAELLYSLDPGWWGQGLVTEAARAVLRHAAETGLTRVIAETDEANAASARVARRLGMAELDVRDGPAGPLHRYSLEITPA